MTDNFYTGFLSRIVSQYIRHPEALAISEHWEERNCAITMKGHKADHRMLLGTSAANLKALQLLVKTIGERRGECVSLKLSEPFPGLDIYRAPFVPKPGWNHQDDAQIEKLLDTVMEALFGGDYGLANAQDNDSIATRFIVEAPDMTMNLEGALNTIFRAIGKANGRIVSVDGSASVGMQ